uniref:GIY-YIG nuclease family protein n=1 Tax=Thaumasiovibrio occultus TaxID=1891184 RepID=UPI000B356FC4|nr:GIY-YIG nuclease family protein [Thaumasiovibrio occultus]
MSNPHWSVYFVRTQCDKLYCGISNDVEKRFVAHQRGRGAKFLNGKAPLHLCWQLNAGTRQQASRLECRLKKLTRKQKEEVIAQITSYETLVQRFPQLQVEEN